MHTPFPLRLFLAAAMAAPLLPRAQAARPWPDTTARIAVFADQLPEGLTEAQRVFAARRLAGTQKMRLSEIRALRAYNPNFLCLHYQLAVGCGPELFIDGDAWTSDWPYVDAQTSWFLLNGSHQRVHQAAWNWFVMDLTYSGGVPNTGYPGYWIETALARMRASENDGTFADSFTVDGYSFGQCDPTHDWLENVEDCQAHWIPSLTAFGRAVRSAFDADPGGFKFLPNLGGLVTGWDTTPYAIGHGGMIEGFAFWGPDNPLDPADWQLQVDRALALVRTNAILICQSYPALDNYRERLFATATYLLIKGSTTYLNLLATGDVALEYYPEYDIPIQAPRSGPAPSSDALWHAPWGVFRRDYTNGLVLVNPGPAATAIPNLGGVYHLVSASGGGAVNEIGAYSGVLGYTAVTGLTLAGYSGAILLTSTNTPVTPTNMPGATGIPNDYDGDRRSDLAVYASESGHWFIRQVADQVLAWFTAWGGSGFTPVVGDFNGDGAADLAVCHEASGQWFIASRTGSVLAWGLPWGGPGFTPLAGDVNADGTADLLAYHEASGFWYAAAVSGTVLIGGERWGGPGMTPVAGDFNGDGAADLVVYQGNSGRWFARAVGGSSLLWADPWGGPGLVPVAGDYDGDNRSDQAVYAESAGIWFIKTANGSTLVWADAWGGPGLAPVAGDFDGDGRWDQAVYHRVSGAWFIKTAHGSVLLWDDTWGGVGLEPLGP